MSSKDTNKKSSSKKETKTGSKKETKTGSKKESKSKKEPKLKVYCGIQNPIPKNYRLGSMLECFEKGKVMYYGVKKIDSVILNSKNNKEDKTTLQRLAASLKGKLLKLKKDLKKAKTDEDKQNIKNEFENIRKEILEIGEKINKFKNN